MKNESLKKFTRMAIGVCLVLIGILMVDSCVHELPMPETETGTSNNNPPPTTTPPGVTCSADTVYFEQTILPLVTTLCGKSGCHGTTNRQEFQLVFNNNNSSYSAIRNRFVYTSNPTSVSKLTSTINEMTGNRVNGFVAPTTDQLNTLKAWITQGSKNNSCVGCDSTKFAFAANVSPIFTAYCISCHPSPGSSTVPNLSTVATIKTELTNNPGRLLKAIQHVAPYNTATTKMPQGSAKLPDCYIAQIRKWINAGAPNN